MATLCKRKRKSEHTPRVKEQGTKASCPTSGGDIAMRGSCFCCASVGWVAGNGMGPLMCRCWAMKRVGAYIAGREGFVAPFMGGDDLGFGV